ncbi:MAG: ion channel, partial [Nitrososphaeraceae archaeon]
YKAERTDVNSQITSMGDALWWTLQTATTSTFGPNVENTEGRILGSIIMLVGIGITLPGPENYIKIKIGER